MSHTIGKIQQNNQQSNNLSQVDRNSLKPEERPRLPMPISDVDYEFLFNQLLEGIAHGWHDRRIVKFFARLSDRASQADWVAWLERLKDKASVLPLQSKRQLGTMMIRLGELTRSTTEADKIGAASYRIGKELLFGKIEVVWEYVGSDLPQPGDRLKPELAEGLPSDFNPISSDKAVENTEESPQLASQAAETESKLNSIESLHIRFERLKREATELPPTSSEKPTSTTFPEEPTADSRDFPESIPQNKQTNSNTIFSSESQSSLSSSKEKSEEIEILRSNRNISETNLDTDKPQDTASSMPTNLEIEALDISQVINLIQEDEELAQQISQKLNSVNAKPQSTLPQIDSDRLELVESWFNLGLKQVSVGEFSKAIASWEKALKIDPNLSEAWHNRGSALGRLGDYPAAIESFQNALAIDPDNYQAWNDRAHALYQLQHWDLAADSWSNAIKIMPGNHLFWYNRGCALEQLERWDEAIASHEKALSIVPDFQPARLRYINLIADSSASN